MAPPLCGQEHGLIDSFRVIRASPFSSTVLHVVDSPRVLRVRLTIMGVDCAGSAAYPALLQVSGSVHLHDSAVFPAVTPDVLSLPLQGADRAVFPIGR